MRSEEHAVSGTDVAVSQHPFTRELLAVPCELVSNSLKTSTLAPYLRHVFIITPDLSRLSFTPFLHEPFLIASPSTSPATRSLATLRACDLLGTILIYASQC